MRWPSFTAGPGPKHLLFSTPGNLYVLPAGFTVVDAPPPVISALAPAVDGNGNPAVAIAGQQFTSSTQILFDGLPAVIQSQTSNLLIVTPPLGAGRLHGGGRGVQFRRAEFAVPESDGSHLHLSPAAQLLHWPPTRV